MKNYEKPVAFADPNFAEGVFMASGGTAEGDCYTTTARMHQKPEGGGYGTYRIQFDAAHSATHDSTAQVLVISFNKPVEYVSSNGTLESGDNTPTLRIRYSYHNNGSDKIGLGDVVINADAGLAVTSTALECNRTCSQHDGLNN